jgi:dihydropyrimidine dehydrogenase (NAD+) subunit PreA
MRLDGQRHYEVIDGECVGCNLCAHVCPVENCITMVAVPGQPQKLTWKDHNNNPSSPNFTG